MRALKRILKKEHEALTEFQIAEIVETKVQIFVCLFKILLLVLLGCMSTLVLGREE